MDLQPGENYTKEEILAVGYEEGTSARFVKTQCLRPTDGRPHEKYFVKKNGLYIIVEPTPENLLFQ